MPNYGDIKYPAAAAATTIVSDMAGLVALSGMSSGDQALVTSLNKLFMYTGSGWFLIATITNASPTAITGVAGTYALAKDGTATTITAVSTDPEGFPLTWSYSTSGLGAIATISNVDNVFTITPTTTEADAGTFTLTISVTDGATGAVNAVSSISISFSVTNSRYTSLLVSANAAGTNSTFSDSSSSGHTITASGDPIQGSFSPYRKGGYEFVNVTTNNARMNVAHNSTLSNVFTIEFYAKFTQLTSSQTVCNNGHNASDSIGVWTNSTGGGSGMLLQIATGSVTRVDTGANGSDNFFPVIGTWYHFAVVRNSSNLVHFYVDGVSKGSFTTSVQIPSTPIMFGGSTYGAYGHEMSFAGIRIVKDAAVYTSNFTPPSEHLADVTGTLALINSKNGAAVDESSNNAAITFTGTGQKFVPSGLYDYAETSVTDGGSISLDTNDYLSVADHSDFDLSSTFTVEGWFYLDAMPSGGTDAANAAYLLNRWQANNNNRSFLLGVASDGSLFLRISTNGSTSTLTSSATSLITANSWLHVSLVYQSNVYKVYLNGTERISYSSSSVPADVTAPLMIGYIVSGASAALDDFAGKISDVRIVDGTAIVPPSGGPTSPLTAVANTKLLVTGREAKVFDKSQSSNLTLVGNTTGSTTQVKFAGEFSTYFDGSSAVTPSIDTNILQTNQNWCVEWWMWGEDRGGEMFIFSNHSATTQDSTANIAARYNTSTGHIQAYIRHTGGSTGYLGTTATTTIGFGSWHHIALVRRQSNGTFKIYIDGVEKVSANVSNPLGTSTGYFRFGGLGGGNNSFGYKGYIHGFKITKGIPVYTANFTPPTESFKG